MGEAKEIILVHMSGDHVENCCFNLNLAKSFFIYTRKEGKENGRRSNMKKIPKNPFFGHTLKRK